MLNSAMIGNTAMILSSLVTIGHRLRPMRSFCHRVVPSFIVHTNEINTCIHTFFSIGMTLAVEGKLLWTYWSIYITKGLKFGF